MSCRTHGESCDIGEVTVQYRSMLDLLLPPIIIVVAFGLLLWIIWRRKPEAERLFAEETKFQTQQTQTPSVTQVFMGTVSSRIAKLRGNREEARKQGFAPEKGVDMLLVDAEATNSISSGQKNVVQQIVDEEQQPPALTKTVQPLNNQAFRAKRLASQKSRLDTQEHPASLVESVPQRETIKQEQHEDRTQYEDILIERIALNPRDIEAYERLGDYYMDREAYDDAKECYKQVLRLSPMNRKAKVRMRKLERILGKRMQSS